MPSKNYQQRSAARVGRSAEHLGTAWLLRNHNVWVAGLPDQSSVDAWVKVTDRSRIWGIQFKTVFNHGGYQTVNLSRTDGSRYSDEVDFVIAVDLDMCVFWLLPISLARKFTRLRLGKKYAGYAFGWHDAAPVFGSPQEQRKVA